MKVEYDFYNQMKKKVRQMETEIAMEEAKMTKEERVVELNNKRKEADQIIKRAAHTRQITKYVPSRKRMQEFSDLYKNAVCFAEYMDCNIIVDSDLKKYGKITLFGENFMFQDFTPKEIRSIFMKLMNDAETIWCTTEEGLIRMELAYNLADVYKVY